MADNVESTVKSKVLPADATLTANSFIVNPDGSVTVKDASMAKLLKDSLPNAVNNPSTEAVKISVGVDF